MTNKTVLITGCSSGFGKLAAKTFKANGWNVVATMRSPEKETELAGTDNMLVTRLDVTDPASIDAAIAQGVAAFGQIDVLVNNAGYGGHAMFEQFEHDHIARMFDTNVFGPMRIAKAVLPMMRTQGGGTIINVTSVAGILGLPFASTYSASKFATQGWSEGLALEYKPFGIKIHTVAPGAFGTNFNAATDNNLDAGDEVIKAQAYKMAGHFEALAEQMRQHGGEEANPQDVADMIYACATSEMPIHNVVGSDAYMLIDMKNGQPSESFLVAMSGMLLPK